MDPLPGQFLCVLGNRHAFDPVTGIRNSFGGISFLGFRSHCHPPFCFHHTTAEEKIQGFSFVRLLRTPELFGLPIIPGTWSRGAAPGARNNLESIQAGIVGVLARTSLADLHGSGGGFRHYVLFQPDPFGEFQQGNTEFLPVFQCHL